MTSRYSEAYFAISLALNIFLTLFIILQLWKCKNETRNILGESHTGHYNFLATLFIESALINVICSALLLISLFGIHVTSPSDFWRFDGMFQIFLAITPAAQVRTFIANTTPLNGQLFRRALTTWSYTVVPRDTVQAGRTRISWQ